MAFHPFFGSHRKMATTDASYEKEGCLHEMFRRQAKKTPAKIAVVDPQAGVSLTYSELDEVTDILANNLRAKGLRVDSAAAIFMERSVHYVVAYIAILKAGGAYIPIDVSYPPELVASVVEESECVVVIVNGEEMMEKAKEAGANQLVLMNDGWESRVAQENLELRDRIPSTPPSVGLDNWAYIVYSSGTTGKPKGIVCPHRGAVFSYHWRHETYPYSDEDDREACNVFFVWEMLRPLLKGATLFVVADSIIYDPLLLTDYIRVHNITRILFTPSLLEAVLDFDGINFKERLHNLKQVWLCGEVVTCTLLRRCVELLPWIKFVNLYSISECHDLAASDLTQWSKSDPNFWDAKKSRKFCPVGRLLPGVKLSIMKSGTLEPQPVGVSGEIYVGGPTLALGYVKRPDLNAQRFVDTPEDLVGALGKTIYRAGDWGYLLSDGRLEICGRCDTMVKIRGYSVELQAVEAALLTLTESVQAAVVQALGEEGEDKHLVAYVVPHEGATKKLIRANLKRKLPFYMVPSYFVFLLKIPLMPATSKLDKKALPSLAAIIEMEQQGVGEDDGLTTVTEKSLAKIWRQILKLPAIDCQDNFFDLGGHSLLATKLLNQVQETFGVQLTVKELFQFSTVSSMAVLIDLRAGKARPRDGAGDRRQRMLKERLMSETEPLVQKLDLVKEVNNHDQGQVLFDMELRAFWRSVGMSKPSGRKRILLTGATGFLGAFLLGDILRHSKSRVFCLVRETADTPGPARLWDTLTEYGVADDDDNNDDDSVPFRTLFEDRVTVLHGDVSLQNLGLQEEEYMYLLYEIDTVIHAAASVNLIYPYQALHGANVLGTQNIILFSCSNKIKPLHYVSTDAVFPHGLKGLKESEEMNQFADKLEDGYSQTKWVAEQLVLKASQRGLPVAVYRLGNQSGERRRAFWNPKDFNLLMLQRSVAIGAAPDLPEWFVEMTPVDFTSRVIVEFAKDISICMGKIFHIIQDKPLNSRWLFEWMTAHNYPVNIIPFDAWRKRVVDYEASTSGVGSELTRLLENLVVGESFFERLSTYSNEGFRAALKRVEMTYPELEPELWVNYFRHLKKRKVLTPLTPKSTSAEPKALEGRVAVVTGASSGIGRAIAESLAMAGARIALAARREDKLLETKKAIEGSGGVAIAVPTDVTSRSSVEALVRRVEATLGHVDILVNNAGVMYYTYMKNMHWEEWEKQIDINCKGVVHGVGSVLESMTSRKSGHIINVSSDAGRRGFAGLAVYSGTKFFIEGFSQALRHEVSGSGVRVTTVQPGDVKTELLAHSTDQETVSACDGSTSVRVLDAIDVAKAVVFAATQPSHVAVNEILVEPREAPI